MNVVVTGAAGFVGGYLIDLLVRQGHQVRAVVRPSQASRFAEKQGIEVVRGDLMNAATIRKTVENAHCIYHVAAKTTKHHLTWKEYYANNVEGSRNLALAALDAGVKRFVYAGSVGVYGTNRNLAVDERTAPRPDSYYRETKLAAEKELLRLHESRGLPVVIARLGTVFGPGSLSFLELCRKIASGKFGIIGNGQNHQHPVYVEDLVQGLQRCGETAGIEGRTYVLAGAESVTLKKMLEALARAMNIDPHFEHLPIAPFQLYQWVSQMIYHFFRRQLPRSHYYDLFLTDHVFTITAAKRDIGYQPKTPLEDGFHRLIQWYRSREYLTC